jgi:hypothetical protein
VAQRGQERAALRSEGSCKSRTRPMSTVSVRNALTPEGGDGSQPAGIRQRLPVLSGVMSTGSAALRLNERTRATLIAIDIKGFSGRLGRPGGIAIPRSDLLGAVEETAFFASTREAWAAQFLGDELRVALPLGIAKPDDLIEFIAAVTSKLWARRGDDEATEVVGVVVNGGVTRATWQHCQYLYGDAVTKAQKWMKSKVLNGGEFAFDRQFAVGPGWEVRAIGEGDEGFVRRFSAA